MAHTEDAHGVILQPEEDSEVAYAEAKRSGHISVQMIHGAGASLRVMQYALEDFHRGSLINCADIFRGVCQPHNRVRRHYFERGKSLTLRPSSARTSSIGVPFSPAAKLAWASRKR